MVFVSLTPAASWGLAGPLPNLEICCRNGTLLLAGRGTRDEGREEIA